jgi:hypothetical protein
MNKTENQNRCAIYPNVQTKKAPWTAPRRDIPEYRDGAENCDRGPVPNGATNLADASDEDLLRVAQQCVRALSCRVMRGSRQSPNPARVLLADGRIQRDCGQPPTLTEPNGRRHRLTNDSVGHLLPLVAGRHHVLVRRLGVRRPAPARGVHRRGPALG